ncbi:MAG: efflux RND transporter periplasmic adaptor subunit [Ignavibacteria bacterium]
MLNSCGKKDNSETDKETPKAIVTVVSIDKRNSNDTLFFNASSVYNNKVTVQSPIGGYLSSTMVVNGMNVSKGDFLFEVVTKEYNALKSENGLLDTLDLGNRAGKIHILAPAYGQISDLVFKQGQYVQEGNAICSIIDLSSLVFKLYVPLEDRAYVKNGSSCTILLPDGQLIPGRITNMLAKTEINTQTETYYLKPSSSLKIPEGLNVKAFIVKGAGEESQFIPKDAVLSNETLTKYWVMKVINDSTAVKIPVDVGRTSGNDIEIKKPEFYPEDRIVLSGNYGLPDTSGIYINSEKEEK